MRLLLKLMLVLASLCASLYLMMHHSGQERDNLDSLFQVPHPPTPVLTFTPACMPACRSLLH